MIRIAIECAGVFLLPAMLYFAYVMLIQDLDTGAPRRSWNSLLQAAPLGWLFALGVLSLVGALLTFTTLQEDGINQPYAPAIFKNGQIVKGEPK